MNNKRRDGPEGGAHKECNIGEMSVRQDDLSEGRSRWSDVECVSGYDKLHQLSFLIILSVFIFFCIYLVSFWFLIGWQYSLSLFFFTHSLHLAHLTLPFCFTPCLNHYHCYQSALTGPHEKKRERESRKRVLGAANLSLSVFCLFVQKEGGKRAWWALIKLTLWSSLTHAHTHTCTLAHK